MAVITHSTLDTTLPAAGSNPPQAVSGTAVMAPMLRAALRDHLRAWLSGLLLFSVGALITGLPLELLGEPDLNFFAAFSAALVLLYIGNLADVQRYRDAIIVVVPALFIASVLGLDSTSAVIIALTLFTHVFLAFIATLSSPGGTLTELRLWPLLLGVNLVLLNAVVDRWLL